MRAVREPRLWLALVGVGLLSPAALWGQDRRDVAAVPGNIPAKVHGHWPNDARDTFWYGDYETAARVARASRRPIVFILNRGATCQV